MSGCYPNYCKCPCHISYFENIRCGCECYFKEDKNVSPLVQQIQKLEEKIKELESSKARADIVSQEYTKIMERIDKLETKEQIEHKIDRICELEKYKHYQIDENRKISRRIDELECLTRVLKDSYNNLYESSLCKKPFKCPICDGKGGFYISGTMDEECHACEGKGIVWG